MKIPLAEHFHSIQGEGQFVGTPMHFLRLAGCSVGRYVDPNSPLRGTLPGPPVLPSGTTAWQCETWDGRKFWCDTDFNKYMEVELEQLLEETWEHHICLTGGEPLIHRPVIDALRAQCQIHSIQLHIETSGTINYWWEFEESSYTLDPLRTWITVSPKVGWTPYMVNRANELKLLVDNSFDEKKLDVAFLQHPNVYLSPINQVTQGEPLSVLGLQRAWEDIHSLQRCQELLRQYPNWKLSIQLHKYIGVR